MAKLIKEQYRKVSNGELSISAYHIVIKKQIAEASGLVNEDELNIYTKDNKIIIEKKKDKGE